MEHLPDTIAAARHRGAAAAAAAAGAPQIVNQCRLSPLPSSASCRDARPTFATFVFWRTWTTARRRCRTFSSARTASSRRKWRARSGIWTAARTSRCAITLPACSQCEFRWSLDSRIIRVNFVLAQERCITMKTSSISLLHEREATGRHLVNLIDSPGTALGCRTHTHTLYQLFVWLASAVAHSELIFYSIVSLSGNARART